MKTLKAIGKIFILGTAAFVVVSFLVSVFMLATPLYNEDVEAQQQNFGNSITDPCLLAVKSSAVINVTSATTTQLVAVVAGKAIYVCGVSMTIAPSATSADTALFEYGTSTNCTGTNALTGTYGAGDLTTAAAPLYVGLIADGTDITAPVNNGLCIVSAGTTVNIQGVLTYVQQ